MKVETVGWRDVMPLMTNPSLNQFNSGTNDYIDKNDSINKVISDVKSEISNNLTENSNNTNKINMETATLIPSAPVDEAVDSSNKTECVVNAFLFSGRSKGGWRKKG